MIIHDIAERVAGLTGLDKGAVLSYIEIPPDSKMGEYCFPCFPVAKAMKKRPDEIASDLAGRIEKTGPIKTINAAGPYLNFKIEPAALIIEILHEVMAKGDSYGAGNEGDGKTVVIDFSSPNIAKPFGIGHLRSTIIGNTLYRLYRKLGYNCVGVNHLGDWGTQFGNLMVAYKRWGKEEMLKDNPVEALYSLYVRFHKESENNPALLDEGREAFARLEQGDEESRQLWAKFRDLSIEEFERIYKILDIRFDSYAGESFYHPMIEKTVSSIIEKGLTKESEGALIIDLDAYKMPPVILRKSDESSTYHSRDICTAIYRYEHYKFDILIYVVGTAQKLHFQQVFKALELMGYGWAQRCVHVDFGLIKFKDDKMSTRKGNIILLEDVLERSVELVKGIIEEKNPELPDKDRVALEVGTGAVIFADLQSKRIKDEVFEWERILNFNGETGPYIQYTHARICSILRKYGKEVKDADLSVLGNDEELAIARLIEQYPSVILQSAKKYEAYILCRYLIELSSSFNNFYQKHRVISDDTAFTKARIILIDCVRRILKDGMYLLGMKSPEAM